MGNAQVSLRVRTPHLECSDRKHIPGGGKVLRATPGAQGLPWELGNNPGNSHPSAAQGEQEQPGFPGITQNKDSPKALPTFQGRTSLRNSFLQPFLQPLEVSQGAAVSRGVKIPQVCSQRPQEPQETLPGPALGFGHTPRSHQGLVQRGQSHSSLNPTGGHPKPFLFSSSKARIHPGIQQWLRCPGPTAPATLPRSRGRIWDGQKCKGTQTRGSSLYKREQREF